MNGIYSVILSVFSLSLVLSAQAKITLENAGSSVQSDLKLALKELAELRSSIASEKIPLLKTVTILKKTYEKNKIKSTAYSV